MGKLLAAEARERVLPLLEELVEEKTQSGCAWPTTFCQVHLLPAVRDAIEGVETMEEGRLYRTAFNHGVAVGLDTAFKLLGQYDK